MSSDIQNQATPRDEMLVDDSAQPPSPEYNRLKRGSFISWRGNKYPEIKLRGFYSDITSIINVDRAQVNLYKKNK